GGRRGAPVQTDKISKLSEDRAARRQGPARGVELTERERRLRSRAGQFAREPVEGPRELKPEPDRRHTERDSRQCARPEPIPRCLEPGRGRIAIPRTQLAADVLEAGSSTHPDIDE